MKAAEVNMEAYLQGVEGQRVWRARSGFGGFLTFEFGRRVRAGVHYRGEWHLWIYQANWRLNSGQRKLVDIDSDRNAINLALRRLENETLTRIKFDPQTYDMTFVFGSFTLSVAAADYLDNATGRDHYWRLYAPNKHVLTVGPAGVDDCLASE